MRVLLVTFRGLSRNIINNFFMDCPGILSVTFWGCLGVLFITFKGYPGALFVTFWGVSRGTICNFLRTIREYY